MGNQISRIGESAFICAEQNWACYNTIITITITGCIFAVFLGAFRIHGERLRAMDAAAHDGGLIDFEPGPEVGFEHADSDGNESDTSTLVPDNVKFHKCETRREGAEHASRDATPVPRKRRNLTPRPSRQAATLLERVFLDVVCFCLALPFVLLIRLVLFLFQTLPDKINTKRRRARRERLRRQGSEIPLPRKLRHVDLEDPKEVDAYWAMYSPKFPGHEVPERATEKDVQGVLEKNYRSYLLAHQMHLGEAQRLVMMSRERSKSC